MKGIRRHAPARDGHGSDGCRPGFGLIWGRWQSENPLGHLPGLHLLISAGRALLPVLDFPRFGPAATNFIGSGWRCAGVHELRLATNYQPDNDNDEQKANAATTDPDDAGKNRGE